MDNSPAIAWAKDENGRFVYLNKTAEDGLQGLDIDWRGKTEFDLFPQDVALQFRENDQKVLTSGIPLTVVEQFRPDDGPSSYWLNIKFPYRDSAGVRYVGGIGVNITDLKNAEESLRHEQDLLRSLIEAQENEKQLLCQEFHDGLIQYAVGALMLLETYQRKRPSTDGSTEIDAAITNLRKGVDDGRRTIRGIRPAILDDSGLQAAIDDLIDQFSHTEILVTCKCDPGTGQLPKAIQTTVYRVMQESLNNAAKHSGTDVVRIELKKKDKWLTLTIHDFGSGFDVSSATKQGFGLRGMIERVRLLGGECHITSDQEAGTCVSIRLPVLSSAIN